MSEIFIIASPDDTLTKIWSDFAATLRKSSSYSEHDIASMKSMFFFGAANVLVRVDHACRDTDSCTRFGEVMDQMLKEVDDVMLHRQISKNVGHA